MAFTFVFPGQGSQSIGMGLDFYSNFPVAKQTFEEADDALSIRLSKMIFEGTPEELKLTVNAQPAILTTSMAIYRTLQAEMGTESIVPKFLAGHSLGEYTALVISQAIDFATGVQTVRFRGQVMQDSVDPGIGGMIAVLGLEASQCLEIATAASSEQEKCYVANDNCPGQIILSGHIKSLEKAIEIAKAEGAKRALYLDVSAPFHCPLMDHAHNEMKDYLENKVEIKDAVIPVMSNVTALPISDPLLIKNLLTEQIVKPVRWRETVLNLKSLGVNKFLEFGPGTVLSGLINKTIPTQTHNLSRVSDLDNLIKLANE